MSPATLRLLTPRRLLMASVVVAAVTITLKTLAWYVTGSVGLLSDAMESFVNLASAIFGLVMVTIAARPADEDHPYGHHKAEYFSSGFEGALIIAAAGGIIVPPRDPAALADALRHLTGLDPEARRELGLAGRARIEREFTLSRIVRRYEHLYDRVIE